MKREMDLRPRYYNRNSEPIGLDQFVKNLGDEKYRVIRQEEIGELYVSTIWLGIDHQWFDGPPLIFETMVFDVSGKALDQERYATEWDAIKGHVMMCREHNPDLMNDCIGKKND